MVNEQIDEKSLNQNIGFHMGCIDTLSKEKAILLNIASEADKLIKMHLQELKKLGVDVDAMIRQANEQQQTQQQQPPQPVPEKSHDAHEPYDKGLYSGDDRIG